MAANTALRENTRLSTPKQRHQPHLTPTLRSAPIAPLLKTTTRSPTAHLGASPWPPSLISWPGPAPEAGIQIGSDDELDHGKTATKATQRTRHSYAAAGASTTNQSTSCTRPARSRYQATLAFGSCATPVNGGLKPMRKSIS